MRWACAEAMLAVRAASADIARRLAAVEAMRAAGGVDPEPFERDGPPLDEVMRVT